MAQVFFFVSFLLTNVAVLLCAQEYKYYEKCEPFFCNPKIGNLYFPFKESEGHPRCGLFSVDCSEEVQKIQLKEGGYWHHFTNISNNNISIIIDKELQQSLETDACDDKSLGDLSFQVPSAGLVESITNVATLLNCSSSLPEPNLIHCSSDFHSYYYYNNLLFPVPPQCSAFEFPLLKGWNLSNQANSNSIAPDFSIQVTISKTCLACFAQGWICRVFEEGQECLIPPQSPAESPPPVPPPSPAESPPPDHNGGRDKSKLWLGLGAAGLVIVLVAVCCFRTKLSDKSTFFRMNTDHSGELVKGFMKDHGPLQVKRYKYLDVKKMTNSFKEKLGQGGCGGVYKGKLKDGRLVAVKVLNRSKGNGEDFMNEVAAISRTSHVNIVSLLGFCFEGSKRALIYEFMPNGSLEKFIFDARNQQEDRHLGWEALDRIALGIARGLEYLHRGCNTRILHFDIKPHNILLNEDFLPKIADFGLAKICNGKESIVSTMCARGTVGYIAPEVFCRSFGGVSHKCDVYSYGMMLSEMAGGRRNINAEAENTSEIYFPHWIHKRLELDEDLGLVSITNEEDKVRARKMIMVSLWCIQTNPSSRPSMKQVIQMLEGTVELEMPPKPYLSSPPRSPAHSSSSVTSASSRMIQ